MVSKIRDSAGLVTQAELKQQLSYDPESGRFTWLTSSNGRTVGEQAGRINTNKYLQVWLFNKRYLLHRLAFLYMDGSHPDSEIDHIDGSRTNNSWPNLRRVSSAENGRNKKRDIRNRSGVTGVYFDKNTGEWIATIRSNGKLISLGSFGLKFFAKQARLAAEKKYGFHANHGKR